LGVVLFYASCTKEDTLLENSFKDTLDNHVYKMVAIGTQIWMAENLAYLPEISNFITGPESAKHYYVYGYEGTDIAAVKATDKYSTSGVLYNWTAANNSCPTG